MGNRKVFVKPPRAHNVQYFCSIFGPTASFTYTKENLIAYTEYEFRLVAENSIGATRSDWVTATTRQDSKYFKANNKR